MKKYILIALLLSFSACSFKQENLQINHYAIEFETKQFSENKKLKPIFIEEVNVNKAFNLRSIFYSLKTYSFEEYVKNRWINLPSNMIYSQVNDSFIKSNIFANVISKDKTLAYEYLLKTELIKLYHSFENEKSYSIVKIKFDLLKNNKIVKTYTFDKKELCEKNEAYSFVVATNKALKESLEELLKDLSRL